MNSYTSVPIETIDFTDTYFNISRHCSDDRLIRSVEDFGILVPPVLLKKGSMFRIISGHNRLLAIRELGSASVRSEVCDDVTADMFIKFFLLKNYRNEIGPIGRIKFIHILSDFFMMKSPIESPVLKKSLGIPAEIISDAFIIPKILALPESLRNYLDMNNVNFRIIRELCTMSLAGAELLDQWVKSGLVRQNIFKKICDMYYDILSRDGGSDVLADIQVKSFDEKRRYDESLFNEIFRIRYPEYSALWRRAGEIMDRVNNDKIRVSVPEYFEGECLELAIRIRRDEDLLLLEKRVDELLSGEYLPQLLNMI